MSTPPEFAPRAQRFRRPRAVSGRAARIVTLGAVLAAGCGYALPAHAQTGGLPVGRIEGDDISVRGEVQVVRENGVTYTSLSSGAQVTVRSGSARIELSHGGEIGICGPARFSLVRSGSSLTLALDYGRVRARVDASEDLRIYTPMIQASPLSTPGRAGDVSVGLAESGRMCVHPAGGAMRLEPQFGGDTIVVPQGMEAALEEGHLSGLSEGGRSCACDALSVMRKPGLPDTGLQAQVALPPATTAADSKEANNKPPNPAPPPPPGEQPIWKVYMPPLSFDASKPDGEPAGARASAMPPPSPETVLLFRQVFVEPVIRLSGEVVEPPGKELAAKPASDAQKAGASDPATAEKKPSFATRVGNFFRRIFGGKPKQKEPSSPPQNAAA